MAMATSLASMLVTSNSFDFRIDQATLELGRRAAGTSQNGGANRRSVRHCKVSKLVNCCSSKKDEVPNKAPESEQRRSVLLAAAAVALSGVVAPPQAVALTSRRANREQKVPESEYKTLPSGLRIYDVTVGSGPVAKKGSRVAVHYVAKWKGITFMTSRQGLGVTGGSPYGFDIGASEYGIVLKGLDQGVEGMRVGGERLLLIPPELAYGNKGVQEIPPGATLEFNVELLSIKQDAFGSRVKVVEG